MEWRETSERHDPRCLGGVPSPFFFSLATSESVDGDANRESILGVEEKRAVCGKKN